MQASKQVWQRGRRFLWELIRTIELDCVQFPWIYANFSNTESLISVDIPKNEAAALKHRGCDISETVGDMHAPLATACALTPHANSTVPRSLQRTLL